VVWYQHLHDDDAHPAQIVDLGAARDERVDVEATTGEDSRYARQHTGLVLHETVQHVPRRDFWSSPKPAQSKTAVEKKKKEKRGDFGLLFVGSRLAGVLYRIFVTASSADRDLGRSILGSGGGPTCARSCNRVRESSHRWGVEAWVAHRIAYAPWKKAHGLQREPSRPRGSKGEHISGAEESRVCGACRPVIEHASFLGQHHHAPAYRSLSISNLLSYTPRVSKTSTFPSNSACLSSLVPPRHLHHRPTLPAPGGRC
jgi:hypothetical protein